MVNSGGCVDGLGRRPDNKSDQVNPLSTNRLSVERSCALVKIVETPNDLSDAADAEGPRRHPVRDFFATGLLYAKRSTLLRCPTCGISSIFKPLNQTRNLHDWFTPLDGCPRCGYPYDREPGYFLMAVWGVNYGIIALIGLSVAVISQVFYPEMSPWKLLAMLLLPMPIASVLLARHAKAWFLALDHFFDPHVKEDNSDSDDGGGNQTSPDPVPSGTPAGRELPSLTTPAPMTPAPTRVLEPVGAEEEK